MYNSYLNINSKYLCENISQIIKELPKGCKLIPVLKDNAYGLGLFDVASYISDFPEIDTISVAHISEGIELRLAGFKQSILVIGNPIPSLINEALENRLTLSVGYKGLVDSLPKGTAIQVMIDSGLHRNGFLPAELPSFSNLNVIGSYSHFADPDDKNRCEEQFKIFTGIDLPGIKHISSSASFENFPEYSLDAVRIGRRLYQDAPGVQSGLIKEAASWRCYITNIYSANKGDRLGYGNGTVLENDCRLASISVGYGDGLSEKLVDAGGSALLNGRRCPYKACFMDQAIIDVSGVECSIGDEVTVFGYDKQGNLLSSQELALLANENEGVGLYSKLSQRVERIYT